MEARFAEPSVLILDSLSGGPKHGYALIASVGLKRLAAYA